MNRNEIIEETKRKYEIVLVDFRVYNSAKELFENEKSNLSLFANETEGSQLLEEDNVFEVNGKWMYSPEWHDVEWDD